MPEIELKRTFIFNKAQALAFADTIVGFKAVGVDGNGEVIDVEKSPEARAFLSAHFGYGNTPTSAFQLSKDPEKLKRLSAFFFVIASALMECL